MYSGLSDLQQQKFNIGIKPLAFLVKWDYLQQQKFNIGIKQIELEQKLNASTIVEI